MKKFDKYQLLTDFANDHPLSEGLEVEVRSGSVGMKTINETGGKYEYAVLLGDIIKGAEHFCYFLERNGYKIIPKRNKSK
jgi:hypothetical protein